MSAVPGMAKADEKNAKLTLKLAAKNGYRAEANYEAISANQWSRILAICEDGKRAAEMAAAPALYEALSEMAEEWHHLIGCSSPSRFHEISERARAALSLARNDAAGSEGGGE